MQFCLNLNNPKILELINSIGYATASKIISYNGESILDIVEIDSFKKVKNEFREHYNKMFNVTDVNEFNQSVENSVNISFWNMFTEEFYDWFGNWFIQYKLINGINLTDGELKTLSVKYNSSYDKLKDDISKVVTEDGLPLIVYHGSHHNYHTFNNNRYHHHFGTLKSAQDRLKIKPVPSTLGKTFFTDYVVETNIKPYFLNIKKIKKEIDGGFDTWSLSVNLSKHDGYYYQNVLEDVGSISYATNNKSNIKSAVLPDNVIKPLLIEHLANEKNISQEEALQVVNTNLMKFNAAEKIVYFQRLNDMTFGFITPDGRMFVDKSTKSLNTPFHEFYHVYDKILLSNYRSDERAKSIIDRLNELVREFGYLDKVKSLDKYKNLSLDKQMIEARAMLIGDAANSKITEAEQNWLMKLKSVLKDLVDYILSIIGTNSFKNYSPEQILNMTLEEFTNTMTYDMMYDKSFEMNTTKKELTPEQRKNIQELKQIEPEYANYSDEVVQEFIESIYPESKIKDSDIINLTVNQTMLEGNIKIGNTFSNFTLNLNTGQLENISIPIEIQGKGFGTDLYLKFNELLNRKKLLLNSSDNLSKSSENLWESLYRKGLVEKIPTKIKRNYEDVIQTGVTDLIGKTDIIDGFKYRFIDKITFLKSPETIQKFKEFVSRKALIQTSNLAESITNINDKQNENINYLELIDNLSLNSDDVTKEEIKTLADALNKGFLNIETTILNSKEFYDTLNKLESEKELDIKYDIEEYDTLEKILEIIATGEKDKIQQLKISAKDFLKLIYSKVSIPNIPDITKLLEYTTIYGDVDLYSYNQPLPEGITFNGNVDLRSYNQPLPKNITFNGTVDLRYYKHPFPENITFNGWVNLSLYNQPLPKNITFNGNVNLKSYNQPLPENITFNGDVNLYSYNQPLPEGITFNGNVNLYKYNQPLPKNITFNGDVNLYKYDQPLPENITFNRRVNLESYNQPLPENITFNGDVNLESYNQPLPENITFNSYVNLRSYNFPLPKNIIFNGNVNLESYNQPLPENITFNGDVNLESYNQPLPENITFNGDVYLYSYNQPIPVLFKGFRNSKHVNLFSLNEEYIRIDMILGPNTVIRYNPKIKIIISTKKISKLTMSAISNLPLKDTYSIDYGLSYKKVPGYLVGAPGNKWRIDINIKELEDQLNIPNDLLLSFNYHNVFGKNPLGWVGGTIDNDILYITEIQSDLLQNLYILTENWQQLNFLKNKFELSKEELDNIVMFSKEENKSIRDIAIEKGYVEEKNFPVDFQWVGRFNNNINKEWKTLKSKIENATAKNHRYYQYIALSLFVLSQVHDIKKIRIPTSQRYKIYHDQVPYNITSVYDDLGQVYDHIILTDKNSIPTWYEIDAKDINNIKKDNTTSYYIQDISIKSAIIAFVEENKKANEDLQSDLNHSLDAIKYLSNQDEQENNKLLNQEKVPSIITLIRNYLNTEAGKKHLEEIEEWAYLYFNDDVPLQLYNSKEDKGGSELVDAEGNVIESNESEDNLINKETKEDMVYNKTAIIDYLLDELDIELKRKPQNQHKINVIKQKLQELNNKDTRFFYDKHGIVYGFAIDNKIYLNETTLNPNILFEEAGHIWINWAKYDRPDLYNEGINKVKGSSYEKDVRNNINYHNRALNHGVEGSEKYEQYILEEALSKAIADNGSNFIGEYKNKFKDWLDKFFEAIAKILGLNNMTAEEVRLLSLKDFTINILHDLFTDTKNKIAIPIDINNLFNENESLANAVYKALGFNTRNIEDAISKLDNPVNKNINVILNIITPSDVYPEEIQEQLHGLDIGDTFVIEYDDGKFNLYNIHPDIKVKIGPYINKEGRLDFGAYDFKKFLRRYLIAEDISSSDIRTILRSSEAEEDFREYEYQKEILEDEYTITPQQKQQAQQLYSQYLEQGGSKQDVQGFKDFVQGKQFQKLTAEEKSKTIDQITKEHRSIQGAYDFGASSNSGKWNSANNELLSLVQDNRKAFFIYKFLIGDMETFKEIVDFLNERGIEIPYTDRMKRADETMTSEERKSAIDSYNNSVTSKIEYKVQVEKDVLSENNLQDETEYTPQELIEKYPLTGVQKVIWNLIKDIVNKLGIKVKFSSSRITEGFDGSNNPQNGEILIRPSTLKNGRFGEVLVHEVVHALTTKIISRVNLGVTTGLTQKQINAVKGLMKLFEAVKADNNLENKYPVKDVFEFIAHLTNEVFVKELESKNKNFLQKIVDFIFDIIGINNANDLAKQYLKDIISDGVFLQENGITVLPSDYGSNIQGNKNFQKLSQEELQQTVQEITKQHRSITALKDLAAKLAHRIGGKVKFDNRTDVDWKGYNQGMTSVLNEAYMTPDTPFHEILAHPIIRAIKKSKPQLYQSLLKELETGRGKEVFEQVKRDYNKKIDEIPDWFRHIDPEKNTWIEQIQGLSEYWHSEYNQRLTRGRQFDTNEQLEELLKQEQEKYNKYYIIEEQQEEAIVTLLGMMAADKLDAKKDATLISKLKELWKQISDFVKSLLRQDGIKIDELPITTTLNDLAEIMAYGNNKIILPGYKVEYSTPLGNKYDTLEEVNNEIRDLADANVEINLENININKKTKILYKVINNTTGEYEIFETEEEAQEYKQNSEYEDVVNTYSIKEIKDKNNLESFIEKNKEYEQSKEIIEQWKKENNIKYDPEEVYSRGQGFYSSIGAYSNLELDLLLKNLIQHIEDNKKSGGEFTISAFTKPINKRLEHIEGTGDRIRFVIYPQSEHIKWAAPTDVYSGSVWDAHEKVSKDKKSELLGVSFTKAPALRNINEISPNLADIIDKLSHAHNELGIELTTNNFRIEYDDNINYSTKKLIDNINKILDDKYGKLEKPKIKKEVTIQKQYKFGNEVFDTYEQAKAEVDKFIGTEQNEVLGFDYSDIQEIQKPKGKQPTQTKDNTTSIENVKNKVVGFGLGLSEIRKNSNGKIIEARVKAENSMSMDSRLSFQNGKYYLEPYDFSTFGNPDESLEITEDEYNAITNQKEYTQQALTNLKIAALKEVARKYPRSLITSKVVPIDPNMVDNSEIQYSKVGSKQDIAGFKEFIRKEKSNIQFQDLNQQLQPVQLQSTYDYVFSKLFEQFNPYISEIITDRDKAQEILDEYGDTTEQVLSNKELNVNYNNFVEDLKNYEKVIIKVRNNQLLTPSQQVLYSELLEKYKGVFLYFGQPSIMSNLLSKNNSVRSIKVYAPYFIKHILFNKEHNLDLDTIYNLVELLHKPIAIFKNYPYANRFRVVLDKTTKINNRNKFLSLIIDTEYEYKDNAYPNITTAYFIDYELNNMIHHNMLLKADKEKLIEVLDTINDFKDEISVVDELRDAESTKEKIVRDSVSKSIIPISDIIAKIIDPKVINYSRDKIQFQDLSKKVSDDEETHVNYQKVSDKAISDFDKLSKREQERLTRNITHLSNKLSSITGIPFEIINEPSKRFKGKLDKGKAIINLAYLTNDTPIHEILGHPIIRYIKLNNPELYNNLVNEINNSTQGKKILENTKELYSNKSEDEIIEESIVELLSLMISDNISKDENVLIKLLKDVYDFLKAIVNKILDNNKEINDNMTFKELSDLLSDKIKNYENETDTYIRDIVRSVFNIELGNEIFEQRVNDVVPEPIENIFKYFKKEFGETNAKLFREIPGAYDNPELFKQFIENLIPDKTHIEHILKTNTSNVSILFSQELDKLLPKEEVEEEIKEEIDTPENISESVDYEFLRVNTVDELLSYKKYYNAGSVLCTYNNPESRLNNKFIFILKRSYAELVLPVFRLTQEYLKQEHEGAKLWREYLTKDNRLKEDGTFDLENMSIKREDPYGTSVMQVQIDKYDGSQKILNRYNHSDYSGYPAISSPDYTYNNDLNNLADKLEDAIRNIEGVPKSTSTNQSMNYIGKVVERNGKLYAFDYEHDGIYYSKYGFLNDVGYQKINTNEEIIIGLYFINFKIKKAYNTNASMIRSSIDEIREVMMNASESNVPVLGGNIIKVYSVKGNNNEVTLNDMSKGSTYYITFTIKNRSVKTLKTNLDIISDNSFKYMPSIEEVTFSEAMTINDDVMSDNINLKLLIAPKVKHVGYRFLVQNTELEHLDMPEVIHIKGEFLYNNRKLKTLNLPELRKAEYSFLSSNQDLVILTLPKLEEFGDNCIYYNNNLKIVDLPSLKHMGINCFYFNRNVQILFLNNMQRLDVNKILQANKSLKSIYIPLAEEISYITFPSETQLRSLYVPNIRIIDDANSSYHQTRFRISISNNKRINHVYMSQDIAEENNYPNYSKESLMKTRNELKFLNSNMDILENINEHKEIAKKESEGLYELYKSFENPYEFLTIYQNYFNNNVDSSISSFIDYVNNLKNIYSNYNDVINVNNQISEFKNYDSNLTWDMSIQDNTIIDRLKSRYPNLNFVIEYDLTNNNKKAKIVLDDSIIFAINLFKDSKFSEPLMDSDIVLMFDLSIFNISNESLDNMVRIKVNIIRDNRKIKTSKEMINDLKNAIIFLKNYQLYEKNKEKRITIIKPLLGHYIRSIEMDYNNARNKSLKSDYEFYTFLQEQYDEIKNKYGDLFLIENYNISNVKDFFVSVIINPSFQSLLNNDILNTIFDNLIDNISKDKDNYAVNAMDSYYNYLLENGQVQSTGDDLWDKWKVHIHRFDFHKQVDFEVWSELTNKEKIKVINCV